MNGFKAFKYYMALRLHFTTPKFNVFVNKGRVKGSHATFLLRNDSGLFERLSRLFNTDRELIQYIASNFMYGNPNMVYDADQGMENYKEYQRRKQSITKVFEDDLHTIVNSGSKYQDFGGHKIPDVIQLYLSKKITIETLVILDDLDGIVNELRKGTHIPLILGEELLKIEKSKGFVRYNAQRVMVPYTEFCESMSDISKMDKIYNGECVTSL